MRRVIVAPYILLLLALATTAEAQGCQGYAGQVIKTRSFGELRAALPKVPAKSEFETTEQFTQRLAAFGSADPVIVAKPGVANTIYNADRGGFTFPAGALFNERMDQIGTVGNPDAQTILKAASYDSDVMHIVLFSKFFLVSSGISQTGSYVGGNALGVRATVKKFAETVSALVTDQDVSYDLDAFVPMELAAAKAAKQTLRIAYVVRPHAPFFTSIKGESPATLDDLRDVTTVVNAISAEVRCALVYTVPDQRVVGVVTF